MGWHDSIASISAVIIAVIIGICILFIATKCRAWTDHEFQARLSGGNDWKITSLPESIARSKGYDMAGKMGYLSYVYAVREDNKWDNDLMYIGPIAVNKADRKWAKTKMIAMMKAVDKALPNEKTVVIMFISDYIEMSVFFGPERWKNKEFHVEAAKKINIEREKWKKLLLDAE